MRRNYLILGFLGLLVITCFFTYFNREVSMMDTKVFNNYNSNSNINYSDLDTVFDENNCYTSDVSLDDDISDYKEEVGNGDIIIDDSNNLFTDEVISIDNNVFTNEVISIDNDFKNERIRIVDESSSACAQAIEYYYSDLEYKYYFTCIKSPSVFVIVDGIKYNIKYALNNGIVKMSELEEIGFRPLKEATNLVER